MKLNDTICALTTPPLISALSLIRVSGEDTFPIVQKLFDRDIVNETRQVVHGHIVDNAQTIDEVVIILYRAPKSFTGEDVIEIISHGSPLIQTEILDALIKYGCRLAERGEFSMRGYLNNKFDLIQAEAINDMIHAQTREAKQLSLYSLSGATSDLILPIKEAFTDLLAHIEVNIDFPEYEDIEELTHQEILEKLTMIIRQFEQLISDGQSGRVIKNGIKVAIIGAPNVGKSSLLNAILKEEKAIVSDIAGTTRDVVEGEIIYQRIPFKFYDTAGIHESQDLIENLGMAKTKKVLADVDYIIYLKDGNLAEKNGDEIGEIPLGKLIVTYSKKDLVTNLIPNRLYVSALKNDYQAPLDEIIKRLKIDQASFNQPSFNNERQLGILKRIVVLLEECIELNKQGVSLDLISVPLQSAYQLILELLGGQFDQDLSAEIFSRFCVGK